MKKRNIMVVAKNILFSNRAFQGFLNASEYNYEEKILNNFLYMEKNLAEENEEYKQPIGYAIVFNPETKKVLTYQRAKENKNYEEKRLQGKWSWGFGGHIEMSDKKESENPIFNSMVRELGEEISITPIDSTLLGYINDDEDAVGKVHIGLLYLINTLEKNISIKDPEIAIVKWRTIEELQLMCENTEVTVESWSKIALEPMKQLFK